MPRLALPLAAAITLSLVTPGHAVTQDNFLARDTRDIIALCSATEADPLFTAAVNFCQGYLVGAFQYHMAATHAAGGQKICLPEPQPSRNEAIRNFVAWARENPGVWSERGVDSMVRFVVSKWSCPSG